MQSRLSRMESGSRNYEEQMQKIRLLHEHIANQRKDFIHKESRRIANAWDAACARDSDLVELSRRLRGADVMSAGFGMFRDCLKYKLERQGKAYIVVDQYVPRQRPAMSVNASTNSCPPVRGPGPAPPAARPSHGRSTPPGTSGSLD